MSNYFKAFPLVDYPGVGVAKNIIARPKINQLDVSTISYTITASSRPDQLALTYYDDENLDWCVYLANNVIDPYYDYFMDTPTLNKVITTKYRSLDVAAQTILYWQSNWRDDQTSITPTSYNSLPVDVKSLYNAITNESTTVVNYARKQNNLIKSTNMIVVYQLATPIQAVPGQQIPLGVFQGLATTVSNVGTVLTVKHVIGPYLISSILGVSAAVLFVKKSISDTEAPYYVPINAYDDAVNKNEDKRNIKLVASSQAENLRKQLARSLSQ